jgi:hypothetical protein
MLHEKIATFPSMVQALIVEMQTRNPSVIANGIIERLYPETARAAQTEGAIKFFQNGVKAGVRNEVTKLPRSDEQQHMAELYPDLFPYVAELRRGTYYVPETSEYVTVAELIDSPTMLDSARKYLRQHGLDTIEEAGRLDELYKAVSRKGRRNP